ncbi:FkbM family methyltransferase [Sphingomonas sp. ERG5]|uniref:FkbM family methyltransferase n=1 Tax=Sphingomonas sp. ERG5 TaxID=1381597 RepID=UPI00069220E1|nr:FkbM family methyltransferase [Sphingomonas sp. ERG5]
MSRIAARLDPISPRLGARLKLAAWRRVGEPELWLASALADRSKVAIDIGANWGPYSGTLIGHCSLVIAFEPNPNLARQLQRAWPGIRVEQCALSDVEGTATLRMPISETGHVMPGYASISDGVTFDREQTVEVDVRRLDDFQIQNVGFVKIDVEGHELAALRGGWETLKRDRPNLLVESQASHCDGCPEAVVELLATLGYAATFLHHGQERPFSAWSPRLKAATYEGPVNMFAFRPT